MMMTFLFVLAILTALALVVVVRNLTGFASQTGAEYVDNEPTLDLPRHLSGPMTCEGMIFGPTGRVTSRFTADMNIVWDGPKGVMSETFQYDDGTTQTREWHLIVADDGSVRAEASDVIGAGSGRLGGNALGLRYKIRLPEENGGHVLDAVDWMYLQADGVILNRSQFRKYGIKVAELFCTIRPKEKPNA
ncbi:hypothetical protein JDO7802_01666 [Jannaschia donghaensis]|uniref:DUF3833 domain-containing protein n=2 Tax=Jannaschia donghaensis TaxID=420998 RepID=A0A0M6YH24_9RHOB|nr:DUF3833 family protein [Jannaschia donghaensis]CTQ49652.1 hypothetical protein JDO7802_01666 [Jannaschia donghaensis]